MFVKRMGSDKPEPEVPQNAFFKKERPNRNKKGRKVDGNPYCPCNDCPLKLSANGKRSTSNFQNVDGCKICFSCGHVANKQWCGTQK